MQLQHAVQWVWIVFLIFWAAAAFAQKRTVRRQSARSRMLQVGIILLASLPFTVFRSRFEFLQDRDLFSPASSLHAVGFFLTLAGCGFAIWARIVLGRNWSGTVTVKEDHELTTRGPYAWVRHPIYSGLLLALLGTALVMGRPVYFLAIPLCVLAASLKLRTEERFMQETFGEQYRSYRQRVKALIPYVL
ncbi:MAG: methyltransferase family protein [Acidobacteriaceae bacterium]